MYQVEVGQIVATQRYEFNKQVLIQNLFHLRRVVGPGPSITVYAPPEIDPAELVILRMQCRPLQVGVACILENELV